MAFFVGGPGNPMGQPIDINSAEEHIFGVVSWRGGQFDELSVGGVVSLSDGEYFGSNRAIVFYMIGVQ